ncbi:helix-turn-helix domain-containing protein [Nocardia sp. NPDC050406]|uniref:helix-turn-helix domain-containing protein n=1 Tax=Nocardia sp. NPDC050406 TaxID=3364318 RepID=UPI003792043C
MSEHSSAEIQRTELPRLRAIPGGRGAADDGVEKRELQPPTAVHRSRLRPLPGHDPGTSEESPQESGSPQGQVRGLRSPSSPQETVRGLRAPHEQQREPLWREALGQRLRTIRQEQGSTLVETAGRAGVSPQYLSEVERGRKEPSSEMIEAMAGALGTSLGGLIQHVADDLLRHSRTFGRSVAPRASTTPQILMMAA